MSRKTAPILAIQAAILAITTLSEPADAATLFTPGNLVVSVEGNGVAGAASGPYTDNQAAPLTLFQYQTGGTSSVTYLSAFVLPQTAAGGNFAISGEYGSSSEGTLQLSSNGRYLTIMGYGVNAAAFNADPGAFSPNSANTALGQSGSQTGQGYTAVPRVVALIDSNGDVNTSTAVYNVFNANNPRSAFTSDGTNIYISGQGTSGDNTGGVFLAQLGANAATTITGNDAGPVSSQDTRTVELVNNTLYVSSDSKSGATNRDYVGTLGTAGNPPLTLANGGAGPAMLTGFGNPGGTGRITVTSANTNGVNTVGSTINLSPENFFFASASVLYVADGGAPKNTSGNSGLGDGGLQKWVNSNADGSGTWSLEYTLAAGLGLVPNTSASGTTGLYGLAGEVVGNAVQLYATSFTAGDTDPSFLFGITDLLSATTPAPSERFAQLATAPADSNFKGVSFAPFLTPEPNPSMLVGMAMAALLLAAGRIPRMKHGDPQ